MSWDIYGQPLPVGHCEVHPSIAQPYPCPECMADAEQYGGYGEDRAEQVALDIVRGK